MSLHELQTPESIINNLIDKKFYIYVPSFIFKTSLVCVNEVKYLMFCVCAPQVVFKESLVHLQVVVFIWEQVGYFHIYLYLYETSFTYQEVFYILSKYYI